MVDCVAPAPAGRGSPFLNLFGGLGLLIAHGFSLYPLPILVETPVARYLVRNLRYYLSMPFTHGGVSGRPMIVTRPETLMLLKIALVRCLRAGALGQTQATGHLDLARSGLHDSKLIATARQIIRERVDGRK